MQKVSMCIAMIAMLLTACGSESSAKQKATDKPQETIATQRKKILDDRIRVCTEKAYAELKNADLASKWCQCSMQAVILKLSDDEVKEVVKGNEPANWENRINKAIETCNKQYGSEIEATDS